MRWLLISSQHHPSHGGIGTYVSRFVRGAIASGWRVDLVTRPGELHPPGARIHEITTPDVHDDFAARIPALRQIERIRPYRYALWSRAVAEYLLTLNPEFEAIEFVDCQSEGYASLCSGRVRQHFRGVPMIVHAHTPMFVEEEINGCDQQRFGRTIYQHWERAALEACDGIIVTSKLLRARMPRSVAARVIPYPIERERIEANVMRRDGLIVLVGSIQRRKGVDTWARSLNDVFAARRSATAVMIGPDTSTAPDGGSMIEHVRRMIHPEHCSRFTWLGALPHEEALRIVASASMVVVPSVFESFSFVAAEALARQTPVLVSDRVGIAEHVAGLRTCPAGDARAWRSAQSDMLADQTGSIQAAGTQRDRMFEACSPQRHLQLRTEFLKSIQAALPVRAKSSTSVDAMDELTNFIEAVESEERSHSLCSSAGS